MNPKDLVKKGYNIIANEYLKHRDIFKNEKEIKEFCSLMPHAAKILDVGCGTGIPIAKDLSGQGFSVIGIDISEKMLELARENVPHAQFFNMDMTHLTFDPNSFDGITATYSIIHIPRENHLLIFQSFYNLLKSNGVILISLGPDEWEGTDDFYGVNMFWSHYSPKRSREMLCNLGFKILFDYIITHGNETHYWILARKILRS